jgi:hypothetical protein
MAAVSGYQALSARIYETNETRRLEDRKEVTARWPSQVLIRCECAFTYMNAVSRKNLTGALAVKANAVEPESDTGCASTMTSTERGSAGRPRHASGA